MSLTLLVGAGLLGVQALFTAAEVAIGEADEDALSGPAAKDALFLAEHAALLRAASGLGQIIGACGLGVVAASLGQQVELPMAGLLTVPLCLLAGRLGVGALASRHADRLAPALAGPVAALARPLKPLIALLARATGANGDEHPAVTREHLVRLIGSAGEGALRTEDRAMIGRVFALSEMVVRDVMVPLSAVDALPRETPLAEAARRMVESGHSRLPVYKDRIDRVIGLVLHQDLLGETDWSVPLDRIARPAFYAPQNKRVDQLFPELQRSRQRLAVVVDEYGGAVGIVTVEDLLEQIVGDIQDESDRPSGNVRPGPGPGEWHASGRATLDELLHETGLRLPEGDYESVAGYLLSVLGRVPRPGERVVVGDFTLTVTRASERAVQEVSLRTTPVVRQPGRGGLR